MTPVRAFLASLFTAILFGAGAFIAARLAGGRPHDLLPLLALGGPDFSLWCFLAAWGALLFAGFGVIAAFLAFIAPEDDEDAHFRRHGFPKGAPILLIALALGLVWFAVRCAGIAAEPPIAAPVEPEPAVTAPAPSPETPSPEAAPAAAPETPPLLAAPQPVAEAASYRWPYMVPLAADGVAEAGGGESPFPDEVENRRLFCGKAWAAVTGSASEEGPAHRNARRALLRTQAAQRAAQSWLDAHQECGPTVVLGVNLGQHAPIAGDNDGAATAYQRQTLVVSRSRASNGDAISAAAATAELQAFLDDPARREALYAGRIFPAVPQILP